MAKKKTNYSITVKRGEVQRNHFITQKECAEYLGIVNTSKKAIQSRCRKLNFEVEFDD